MMEMNEIYSVDCVRSEEVFRDNLDQWRIMVGNRERSTLWISDTIE